MCLLVFCFINTVLQRSWDIASESVWFNKENPTRFRTNCCGLFRRCLTKARFRRRRKKKCISFILTQEELISKQEATSLISAGALRSTYIFKWVSASYSFMGRRRRIFLCWFLFLLLPELCSLCIADGEGDREHLPSWRAAFGALAVASRAMISSSQKLCRRNASLLPKPRASTSVSLLFSMSNRSICCSSTVPATRPSIPPWSAQRRWKSRRSVFTAATSKKSSRFWSTGGNEESVWWSSCVQSAVRTLPFSPRQPMITVWFQRDQ